LKTEIQDPKDRSPSSFSGLLYTGLHLFKDFVSIFSAIVQFTVAFFAKISKILICVKLQM